MVSRIIFGFHKIKGVFYHISPFFFAFYFASHLSFPFLFLFPFPIGLFSCPVSHFRASTLLLPLFTPFHSRLPPFLPRKKPFFGGTPPPPPTLITQFTPFFFHFSHYLIIPAHLPYSFSFTPLFCAFCGSFIPAPIYLSPFWTIKHFWILYLSPIHFSTYLFLILSGDSFFYCRFFFL